jgi:hypothetical protein
MAPVKVQGKFGFIDHAVNMVIPAQFDWVQDFSGGLSVARLNNRIGYIDRSGKFVWSGEATH